uniref:Metalloendopeptidase n=1 Tax=Gouania willdenowi TaxID=441366 RepID=A0A8C5GVT3_GOUWI
YSVVVYCFLLLLLLENVHRTFYEETNFLFTNFLPDTSDFLLEGDIVLPKTRNALKCLNRKFSCLWPKRNGRVEIFQQSEHFNTEKADILRAMKGFEWKTCIRFIPRSRQTGYLSIVPRFGCSSLVGYLGDKQMVSLQKFGCITQGIIQHELLHALGFYHEHTRSDRDYYVTINWQNVQKNFEFNFQKQDTNNQDAPYDYSSVMHYGRPHPLPKAHCCSASGPIACFYMFGHAQAVPQDDNHLRKKAVLYGAFERNRAMLNAIRKFTVH